MELLRFTDLERHYGANEVFSDLTGVIRDGEKIGLVGPNGAGKSTLVRILVGRDEPDGGSLVRARDRRLGYLAQDAAESGPQTLRAAFDEAMERGDAAEADGDVGERQRVNAGFAPVTMRRINRALHGRHARHSPSRAI